MTNSQRGMTYRKSQRYDPNRPDPYEYKCDECGGPLGDTHAGITLANEPYRKYVCNDCAAKIADNKFYSLKDKEPEDTLDDFGEL